MKKFAIHIVWLLGMLLAGGACTKEAAENPEQAGEGAVSFAIAVPQSRAEYDDTQYPWTHCVIRIYKLTEQEGEVGKELIRRYNSRTEMPSSLWLLEGDYSIAVEAGDFAETGFRPSYRGEKEFRIAEGKTTTVEVVCDMVNTVVKVVYDKSVPATFKKTFGTTVAFDERYTQENIDEKRVPYLVYETSAAGYFILPEATATLCWRFYGEGEKNGEALTVDKTGAQEISTEPGVCYELKFKYSKDLGGALDFTLTLKEDPDEVDDPVTFIPNPQITGEGFDLSELQRFSGEPLVLAISSIADMQAVRIETEAGDRCEVAATTAEENADGIAVNVADATNMTVALGGKFFGRFGGGNQVLTITAIDQDSGESTKTLTVRTQGALLPPTDPWFDDRSLRACVFSPATEVKMEYRKQGESEWSVAELTHESDDIYSTKPDLAALGADYEYRLLLDGTTAGAAHQVSYPAGPQIYNAGFEVWSGSKPLLPYQSETDRNDQWWDTGNHGSSKANINVTTKENDTRPGSSGSCSAKLTSQKASLLGIGKFAAGNIFLGKYLGTDGMDGVIGFGKPFDFTYRPKALSFWYKGNIGTINERGNDTPSHIQSGDSDVSQVYICLCKMGGPHVVKTKSGNGNTLLDFSKNSKTMSYCTKQNGINSTNDGTEGHIVAWAEWTNSQSMPEWTEITLELHYNEEYEGEVPTYLMLTASASKYGDYFTGSTSSFMYLDDMELVY
ncbi:MAG: PCMD domain-containing protein [Alistipes sp.]|nr:PCMD domain-containing protein [Alistipes senegalensis]MCM1250942.1 PCMD domain-containing protein [Alistipes sp.]